MNFSRKVDDSKFKLESVVIRLRWRLANKVCDSNAYLLPIGEIKRSDREK